MSLTASCQNKNGNKPINIKAWMAMRLTVALLLFFTLQVSAKNIPEVNTSGAGFKVSGMVRNALGDPLIGVSVNLKGTQTGTTTDANGNYSLTLPDDGGTLVFSYIGFTKQEIPVNRKTKIDVVMQESIASLDQVVVVGYGTQKRKDVTGSISSISDKDITSMPVATVSDALAGQIPGLDVLSSGGRPGSGSSMLLRGNRSFTASNAPLVILDGMTYYGSLDDINPYEIKSIDVLKDASATAIYGSRGANGVIIIATKRGLTSAPRITLDAYAGPEVRFGTMPYANAIQYAAWAREAYRASGGYPYEGINPEYDAIIFDPIELQTVQSGDLGTNYQDSLLQNGAKQRYQLNLSGGTKVVRYNISGNYFRQEGIMPGDIFSRINLSPNIDFTFSPKVTAGTSIHLSYRENTSKSNERALQYAINGDPLGRIHDLDGTPRFSVSTDGYEINPMADYLWDSYRESNKGWSTFLNAYVQVKITPDLTYRVNLGTNFSLRSNGESSGFHSIANNLGLPTANVSAEVRNFKSYESILTYDKEFNNTDHHLTITAVQGVQSSRTENNGADVRDLPYENSRFYNIGSANQVDGVNSDLSEWKLASFVGRVFYGYKSKYLLSLSMRADGASQFSPTHKWGYFPAAALAYNIAQENFMKGTEKWLSELKFRLSYGVTGNQAISPYQTQGSLIRTAYNWAGDKQGFGYGQLSLANKDLKWESTEVYNLGLDFGVAGGKVHGSIDLYNTNTYDLLMFRKLPISSGYEQVLQNVGSTNNKGIEISLSTINITKPDFKWSSRFSISRNRNKITELFNGKEDDIGDLWFIGQPINVYYDVKKIGIWQTKEKDEAAGYGRTPGQIKVLDLNDDGLINDKDRMVLGNNQPDVVGDITNQLSYKNWDLSFSFNIRLGGIASISAFAPFSKKRYNKLIFDYWTPSNPTNSYPRPNQLYEGSGLNGSTLAYRDAGLISLRQVSFGYNIPGSFLSKMKISSARVFFSGQNLWYRTASELRKFNMKADWSQLNYDTYPATRTMVLGVHVNFNNL